MKHSPTAVRVETIVKVPRARAFDVFTEMGSWWPPDHHTGPEPWVAVVVERDPPHRWFERDAQGREAPWGRVLAYEPPERLLLDWQLDPNFAYDPEVHTRLEVRFEPVDDATTRVELVHELDGYGENASMMAEIFSRPDAWQGVIDAFAAVASRG